MRCGDESDGVSGEYARTLTLFCFLEYICSMQDYIEQYFGKENIVKIEPLVQAGSNRKYYRIFSGDKTFIGCESSNTEENETFFYFSEFFKAHQVPVPTILQISKDRKKYIQEDVGTESLLDTLIQEGYTDAVKELYKKSVTSLVTMQLKGGEQLDFTKCFSSVVFDRSAVLADLNYFKYFFLDLHKIEYNKVRLNDEFDRLSAQIGQIRPLYFMYRDFQGRNIIIKNSEPHFIDYQGGMKGPLQYDVASLLWQAKAQLPAVWRTGLYAEYKQILRTHIVFDDKSFDADYSLIVLVRLLQVLGSYGLRGIIERRAHFLSSIPLGLANVNEWRSQFSLDGYDELSGVLVEMAKQITEQQVGVVKSYGETKLNILVQSFSYKQGIPEDVSGNGGGFVFDCRGLLNPGRFEEYKKQTGRDPEVIDFLESKTKVNEFLNHVQGVVDMSIDEYLSRGFEHLMISFGCTGGQHRSVYCTDAFAKHVKEKYNIDAVVKHVVQDAKSWIN